jgi:hypothetical protein
MKAYREYLIVKIEEDMAGILRAVSERQLGINTFSLQSQSQSLFRYEAH